MALRIFTLICGFLIPAVMIIFGNIFLNHPPGKINMAYGYRTTRSMKNQETWEFAHEYCGLIWKKLGIIIAVITGVASLAGFFLKDGEAGTLSIILIHLQVVVLLGSIYPVEKALKKNFDEDGNRREK